MSGHSHGLSSSLGNRQPPTQITDERGSWSMHQLATTVLQQAVAKFGCECIHSHSCMWPSRTATSPSSYVIIGMVGHYDMHGERLYIVSWLPDGDNTEIKQVEISYQKRADF